jgi:hypothetical protein
VHSTAPNRFPRCFPRCFLQPPTGSPGAFYRPLTASLGANSQQLPGDFKSPGLVLDTKIIAEPMFGQNRKLELLGKDLGVDCHAIHNAGNDANSTMRLLLILAVGKMDRSGLGAELKERLQLLKKIAKAPSERLPRHIEHVTLEMEEPVNVKLPVEEAVDQVEDWYDLCDTLTQLYVEE